MTKIQSLFARFVLVFAMLFAAAPLTGCDSGNKLPDMHLIGDKGPVTTGQYNVTRAAERNWFAMQNTAEFVFCWAIILLLPWGIIFGVSGWMFGKFEKPGEIVSLVVATALMWRWATSLDLEPWLLVCWIAPCVIYVFLKGEEKKMTVFAVFTGLYMFWSGWVVFKAILSAFTYHPLWMIAIMVVVMGILVTIGDEGKKEAAHSDNH